VIKRYQNRKLYNTEESCYMQLEDVGQIVKKGKTPVVICKKHRHDITNMTLMSVIHQNENAVKSKPLSMGFMGRILNSEGLTSYATALEGRLQ
jgi:polyhydroxyalkanoate synthesis repressor PhaR